MTWYPDGLKQLALLRVHVRNSMQAPNSPLANLKGMCAMLGCAAAHTSQLTAIRLTLQVRSVSTTISVCPCSHNLLQDSGYRDTSPEPNYNSAPAYAAPAVSQVTASQVWMQP